MHETTVGAIFHHLWYLCHRR